MNRQERLADDMQAGGGQQIVDVGDAAGDRILDRDHAEIGSALLDRGESVLEGRARQRNHFGKAFDAGDMRIGAGFALIGDGFTVGHACLHAAQASAWRAPDPLACRRRAAACRRARCRFACPPPARAIVRAFRAAPAARAARPTKRASACAAIGVEADVMKQRPLAPWRAGAGEIERAQTAGRNLRPHRLDHIRIVALPGARDRRRQRRDIDFVIVERPHGGAHRRRLRSSAGRPAR